MTAELRRRELLRACGAAAGLSLCPLSVAAAPRSPYGDVRWSGGLPVFSMPATPADAKRHFHMVGNRALQIQAGTDGSCGVYEESEGQRWLVAPADNGGSGVSTLCFDDGRHWSSAQNAKVVTFLPTGFKVAGRADGITVQREVLCPEGDQPWLLIRVEIALAAQARPQHFEHIESWQLRPRPLQTFEQPARRDTRAAAIRYVVSQSATALLAHEDRSDAESAFGPAALIVLESLNPDTLLHASADLQPLLRARTKIDLKPGASTTLWFRFGYIEAPLAAPAKFYANNRVQLGKRLPQVRSSALSQAAWEVPWHYAALSGGANRDSVLGGHTLNQGAAYAFFAGGNAAARDSLQHALPLIYSEPDLALSVLKNVCAWGSPDGDLPYALGGDKKPLTGLFRPSDQNLWALWLAAEYGLATGDCAAFSGAQHYHPIYRAEPVTLKQHLLNQYKFFLETVATGACGHVRILNADWNDLAIDASGAAREAMIARGGSVLNSAMAAWVLPVFAKLLDKLDEALLAEQVRSYANTLKARVKTAWNGRWFDRAYAPDGRPIGRDRCWLEVQPWAILCGAASAEQAAAVLDYIDRHHRRDSPFGARLIWPLATAEPYAGDGIRGGIWYSVNMTLIWAAAKYRPEMALDEWRRMSLHHHRREQPEVWEGTLSGPDAWNSPESSRPGRTWHFPWLSMQAYPVGNMHSHSAPALAYLRLLGVDPGADEPAARPPASVGSFKSQHLSI